MIISRFRRLALIAVIGAAVSTGLVVPTSIASAQPVLGAELQRFNIHVRSNDQGAGGVHCVKNQPFGREGSRCNATGYYDDSSPMGFRNVNGGVVYDSDGKGGTYLKFYTSAGEVVEGNIPSRGSSDFTISSFNSPAFGTLARVTQKLYLDVRTTDNGSTTGDRWVDFYLRGQLVVETPRGTGFDPGEFFDDVLGGLKGAFGSS